MTPDPIIATHGTEAEAVCSWGLKILAQMASLSRAERDRVLRHAVKVNRL